MRSRSDNEEVCKHRGQTVLIHRRSKTRTIDITVKLNGPIVVSAPRNFSRGEVHRFLREQNPWIEAKLAKFRELRTQHPPKRFREGEIFYFLGRPRRLRFERSAIDTWYSFRADELICFVPKRARPTRENVKKSLIEFYRKTGVRYLRSRLVLWAKRMKVDVKSVRFASQKSRWGSCSRRGCISLNWRLIFAPPGVIDSILVHELAHLKRYDHTPEFWRIVKRYIPDYANKQRWLEEHQYDVDFLAKRSELHPS